MNKARPRADDRGLTDALNEAMDADLDIHQWQNEHIQEGIRQADAGEFAGETEVAREFSRWRE
jgi:predicted transcriptional regulator